MTESIRQFAEWSALIIEAMGVLIIAGFAIGVAIIALGRSIKGENFVEVSRDVRQRLGRGILLGLEFLVAADIIHTVAVELTFETVAVLAIIVVIRTFLSFSLELELTGKWPWQQEETMRRA